MSEMLKPAIQKHQKKLKHHVSDFFFFFCRVQSTSNSEADVCYVRLKKRNWERGFTMSSIETSFSLCYEIKNMMGIVVQTDLHKVLLIKSIKSNHVNPIVFLVYINKY